MNKAEAINAVMQVLAKVNFTNGVINPATNKDTGEEAAAQFLDTMKQVIFGKTGGVIYKMKEAKEFYTQFCQATADPKTTPDECALYFLAAIKSAQNSALSACKAVVPEAFHSNIDELYEVNSRRR